MKKKVDGTLQGRLTAHEFSKKGGEHYNSSLIHAPKTNAANDLHYADIDVNGQLGNTSHQCEGCIPAWMNSRWQKIYIKASKGFKNVYGKGDVVLFDGAL